MLAIIILRLGLNDTVNTGGDYYVKVENDGYADIYFGAETAIQNESLGTGKSRFPLFVFRDNLESVKIIDRSNNDMHIVGVDVISRIDTKPLVQIKTDQGNGSFDTNFGFDLRHSISPNLITVDIQKLDKAKDIYLDGSVINPTGWTRIINQQGDILSGSGSARIETNILDIEATAGHIGGNNTNGTPGGSNSQRVNVDLIKSTILAELPVPGVPSGTREVAINALAGGDAYLSLQTLDRIDHAPETLTIGIDSIKAGNTVNVVLEDSMHQIGGGVTGDITVYVQKTGFRDNYSIHFDIPKNEPTPLYKDRAAYVSATGSTRVDSYYEFELKKAIQPRGNQENYRFTGVNAFPVNVNRDTVDPATAGLVAGGDIVVNADTKNARWTPPLSILRQLPIFWATAILT